MLNNHGIAHKKNIVMLPRHATSWVKLLELAQQICTVPTLQPIMIIANDIVASLANLKHEKHQHIMIVDLREDLSKAREKTFPLCRKLLKCIEPITKKSERIGCSLPIGLIRLIDLLYELQAEKKVFINTLQRLSPDALLLPGDRELSPVVGAIKAANELKIPAINAVSAIPDADALQKHRNSDVAFRVEWKYFPPLLNLLAAWLYPGQVHSGPEGKTLFSPGWRTLALAAQGMMSEKPWVQGGGNSDYVLEINRQLAEAAHHLGRPVNKSIIIGDQTLDPLFAAWEKRKDIKESLSSNFSQKHVHKKLTIFSVPNDAEHGLCDMPTHLSRLQGYFQVLAKFPLRVCLSLHPKSKPEDYKTLADKFGFVLLDKPLSYNLPAADLFIASASSTISWALKCGIRTINIDYLLYRSPHFSAPVGIEAAETPEQFDQALKTALFAINDPKDCAEREHQALEMRKDALFDGKAGQRIIDFLQQISHQTSRHILRDAKENTQTFDKMQIISSN